MAVPSAVAVSGMRGSPCSRVRLASAIAGSSISRLALPCHLRLGRAFLPRRCVWRRSAMDGSAAEGWEGELERWLEPFLARLRRKEQRRWAPVYLKGLILPGERKSVEPMAARVAP